MSVSPWAMFWTIVKWVCAIFGGSAAAVTIVLFLVTLVALIRDFLLGGKERCGNCTACKSAGLRKIILKPGRWYEGDVEKRVKFD